MCSSDLSLSSYGVTLLFSALLSFRYSIMAESNHKLGVRLAFGTVSSAELTQAEDPKGN